MCILSIAKSFSETPGPRYTAEGNYSGEKFRSELLEPQYLSAKTNGEQLLVDLDGTDGYATSFLEEAFGGLARQFPCDDLLRVLRFKSEDEPFLEDEIRKYIREANQLAA